MKGASTIGEMMMLLLLMAASGFDETSSWEKRGLRISLETIDPGSCTATDGTSPAVIDTLVETTGVKILKVGK